MGLLGLLLCVPLAAETPVRFAEELFPELGALMEAAATGSTELRLRTLRIEERAGDLDVAVARRRPSARLYGRVMGSYETRDDIPDDFRGDINANLTLSQPLYQWGNLKRQEVIAERQIELEEIEMERTGARQFMEIRRAYLNWLLMREQETILEQSIALSERFVEARKQLVAAGQSSEQDVLEMEARLLENKERLSWVEKNLTDLRHRFVRFAGPDFDPATLDGDSLARIEPMPERALQELKQQVRGESLQDPLVERYDVLETIETERLAILEKQHWPMLDLVAGIFSDRLDAVNQEDSVLRLRYFAGVQVNWNIFDSWQTEGHKRSALARRQAYALRKADSEADNLRESESLLADLELNLRQIEARGKRERLLDRRMTLLREQAQRDLITGVELIEGEIDYLEVRRRLMEARVSYLMNLMEIGLLLEMDPAARYYSPER
ncbi:MAG TPA: TolC family protein [Oceanipulchritudo sp.]|nr:TolC family protein [Oceanipulchritudo sp.]